MLKKIMNYLPHKIYLNIIKYNKEIQKVLDISIIDYIKYTRIEIEIIPKKILMVNLLIFKMI